MYLSVKIKGLLKHENAGIVNVSIACWPSVQTFKSGRVLLVKFCISISLAEKQNPTENVTSNDSFKIVFFL